MVLSAKELKQFRKSLEFLTVLLDRIASHQAALTPLKRKRRAGKELIAFRKMLVSERNRGVPVAELAAKHSVSVAYIYQLPGKRA